MASTYDINIREQPYNARGDGVHDETDALRKAIRDASDTSKHPTGARVYVPPGKYVMFRDSTNSIQIKSSNITIFGDGPQSTIFIPTWLYTSTSTDQAYFIIAGDSGNTIENIHIQNLRVQSIYDDTATLNPPPNSGVRNLFQRGAPSLTEVVHNSGFTDNLAENLGGCAFAFNGGDNDPASGNQSQNNYVIRNTIRNCAFTAINPFSGGHMNTIISDNFIDGNASFGVEWSSPYALITNNIIRRTRSSAIAFENAPTQEGWTIFANNNILECGNSLGGTSVSPAIQIGEDFGGRHIMIVNNVIRRAYGPGIVIAGSQSEDASDIIIQGNIIDEFGVEGVGKVSPLGWIGIDAQNHNKVIVTNNVVRAGTGPTDRCDEGIATGGGNGIDTWTDGNITIGDFSVVAILTTQSAGTAPPSAGTRDRIGLNYDITAGLSTPGYDYTNTPYIPDLPPGPSPSVDGSNIWRLSQRHQ
jgi:hypothetical protein